VSAPLRDRDIYSFDQRHIVGIRLRAIDPSIRASVAGNHSALASYSAPHLRALRLFLFFNSPRVQFSIAHAFV
jgi:hypothetical protein